jgi:hypothetical protein
MVAPDNILETMHAALQDSKDSALQAGYTIHSILENLGDIKKAVQSAIISIDDCAITEESMLTVRDYAQNRMEGVKDYVCHVLDLVPNPMPNGEEPVDCPTCGMTIPSIDIRD